MAPKPALAKTASMRPKRSSAAAAIASTWSHSVTSQRTASARSSPPSSAASSSSCSSRRAASTSRYVAGGGPRGRGADAAAGAGDQQDRVVGADPIGRRFCRSPNRAASARIAIIRGSWILSASGRSGSSSRSASPCCSPWRWSTPRSRASTEAKEPSQLLSAAPGTSYEMTGKVVKGSVAPADGDGIALPRRRPRRRAARACRSPTRGTVPDPFRGGREIVLTGEVEHGTFVGEPDTLVTKCPSKFTTKRMTASLGSAAAGARLPRRRLRGGARRCRPQRGPRWVDLSRRAVYALLRPAHRSAW